MSYADTSFISSCYVADDHTETAVSYLEKHRPRLPFIFLHWAELAKATGAKSTDADADWERIKSDVLAGEKLHVVLVDCERVGRRAAGLLRSFYPRWQKLRTLDAMHVAAAIEGGHKTFISFDSNSYQRVLAATQRLQVWPALTHNEQSRLKQ